MKETDITQDSPNGQPYIQRNFIRYGRKPDTLPEVRSV